MIVERHARPHPGIGLPRSLHDVDRIKDCIRRRGENIPSVEVEQVLNTHLAIAESAVVGINVAGAGGEGEVKAYVEPRTQGDHRCWTC